MILYDTAIVGGGPIGIELAAGLQAAGLSAVILEAGQIGSTMSWWAPETRFFSSPERIAVCGIPLASTDQNKATGEQYLAYLRQVVAHHDLKVQSFSRVVGISPNEPEEGGGFVLRIQPSLFGVGGPWELQRAMGGGSVGDAHTDRFVKAKNVVLAVGNMHRPRMLEVEGEGLPHVSHYFEGPHKYFGQEVLIIGGKNSAVEAALRCHRVGARVTIAYRGEDFDAERIKYWLLPELRFLIDKGHIRFLPRTEPTLIEPGRTVLSRLDGGQPVAVDNDFVLLLTGYVQDASLFEQLGVKLLGDEHRPHYDHDSMETNAEGVFVAGTACGGSQQRARVFIENSHVHVARIVRTLTKRMKGKEQTVPWDTEGTYAMLEES